MPIRFWPELVVRPAGSPPLLLSTEQPASRSTAKNASTPSTARRRTRPAGNELAGVLIRYFPHPPRGCSIGHELAGAETPADASAGTRPADRSTDWPGGASR